MPKIFTEAEKDRHREVLFDKGFRLISEKGYKNVKVDQLVELIEASKGYFYTLFDSKEEYFLGAIAWQMEREYDRLKEAKDDREAAYRIGTQWCISQCRDLLAHGVPAVHFYTMGRTRNIVEILKECF